MRGAGHVLFGLLRLRLCRRDVNQSGILNRRKSGQQTLLPLAHRIFRNANFHHRNQIPVTRFAAIRTLDPFAHQPNVRIRLSARRNVHNLVASTGGHARRLHRTAQDRRRERHSNIAENIDSLASKLLAVGDLHHHPKRSASQRMQRFENITIAGARRHCNRHRFVGHNGAAIRTFRAFRFVRVACAFALRTAHVRRTRGRTDWLRADDATAAAQWTRRWQSGGGRCGVGGGGVGTFA